MEEANLNPSGEEEKEEGELEDGELEDEEEEEEQPQKEGEEEDKTDEGGTQGSSPAQPLQEQEGGSEGLNDDTHKDGEQEVEPQEGKKKESKSSKGEKKRKHKDDDEEREKKRKKKKKRKHVSSEEEETEEGATVQKFTRKMIPPTFDSNMGFDAMLQQEMFLRGRSPPPGMIPFGAAPPGTFGPPMFRGRPMSDYDSYDSGSDSEMRDRHRRRRRGRGHRRSRSRSRSPSRKNEAICMYYMQGSCQRGKACPYSHDIQPQRKMELCKFYMMDCCAKKEKCLYMHHDFPCKYYHTGLRCKLGSKCKFSHGALGDSARQILLKHIELAPKDILGDFPRLTKEAAQLVVDITEAHRRGHPMTIDNIPGIMEMKGRGFKYVDKAIKAFEKKQGKNLKEEEQDGEERLNDSGDRGNFEHQQQHQRDTSNMDRMPKSRREQQEAGDKASEHIGPTTPQKSELVNGEGPPAGPFGGNSSQAGVSPSRNLMKSFMARMPQKQRELLERIEQQHSVQDDQDDAVREGTGAEESGTGPSNMNWYSSDEDGDGSSLSKHQGQSSGPMGKDYPQSITPDYPQSRTPDYPQSRTPPYPQSRTPPYPQSRTPPYPQSRTPPPPQQSFTPPRESLTPPGRPGESPAGTNTSPKMPFSNINLDNINIPDLASVLSALKNQNANNSNRGSSEDLNRRQPPPQSPRHEPSESSQSPSRTPRDMGEDRDMAHNQPRMSRDPRGASHSSRFNNPDYPINPWMRDHGPGVGRWDSSSNMDTMKDARGMREEPFDLDHRQRTGDIDLRVLPGMDDTRPQTSEVNRSQKDTDMRISSEPSIYDVDLRQLGLPNMFKDPDDDSSSLPFKVPIHTPAKEIVASISSHSPMYYQLVKVCVPKPNFSHLKVNKDDPKIMEDPRLRRMLRRNSNEDSSNRSPRAPSRYELDGPMSPPAFTPAIKIEKFPEADTREPKKSGSRDPRAASRVDPRSEPRGDPRGGPRMNSRTDPRMSSRGDPRTDSRDPRGDPMGDMRNTDPRMFPGGNMMEGPGMPHNNMGGGGPMGGMQQRNVDPRNKPGLLGPAPLPFPAGVPPHGMGPQMGGPQMGGPRMGGPQMGGPPFMMGQMGPNGGFYPEDSGEMMGGGGGYPQGGPGWGGRMSSNDPRFKRDMGDGRSYTPPPLS